MKWTPGAKLPAFDWDDANTAHIARHGVSRAEAEHVILGAALPVASEERGGEERHIEVGETIKERLLVVVWTWRGRRIRVVTAYPASRKWRALWKRIKGGSDA